jgi:uncharacterized protein YbcI
MPPPAVPDSWTAESLPLSLATEPSGDGSRTGNVLLQISNALVRLYKDAFGRGPTKARTQYAGPDTLVVLLEDSMTVAERNLAAKGAYARVRESRLFLQYELEADFRAAVERLLGRRTTAFISGIDTRHDVSVDVFTLEPLPAPAEAARDGEDR